MHLIMKDNLTDSCQKTKNIRLDLIVLFSYDSSSGTFTVPPGGDGFYYFSVFLTAVGDESAYFDVEINGQLFCTVFSDLTESPTDTEMISCSADTYAVEVICNKYFRPCSY